MEEEQPVPGADADEQPDETEVVDGILVLASARTIEPLRREPPPLRQVAAVAATGFVAGAATAAVLGRRRARQQALRPGVPPAPLGSSRDALEVVASRRFIVDVHTLSRR